MATKKTAISIQESLFEQAESLAKKLNISRSRLFVLAVEDFIQHYENWALFEEINRVYDDEPDLEEQSRLSKMQKHHLKVVEGEW